MRLSKTGTALLLVLFLCLGFSGAALADDPIIKLSRGITNLSTCWVEYWNQYMRLAYQRDPFLPIFEAILYGTVGTAQRIAVGAYDTATFLLPAPPNYAPLMVPETPLEESSRMMR